MMDWTVNDQQKIANNMIEYGDKWIIQLGYLLRISDQMHQRKLAKVFAKYFTKYYYYNES